MTDHGPYETSDEVRRLPAVRAVYDAMRDAPGPGTGKDECEELVTAACEKAGITLGTYDARIIRWLANWDPETCAVVAGLIARAYKAGKAAGPDGTVTEWGVTLEGYGNEPFASAADEDGARLIAASFPQSRTAVVRCEVGPWTPVPGEEKGDA
jgi:hypothetical protein